MAQAPVSNVFTPYDGYLLRPGDRDQGRAYGPRREGLSAPGTTGDHVLQLQEDLLMTGYWSLTRARVGSRPVPGEYHESMVGAVLALKEDLCTFYGIAATTDIGQCSNVLDGPILHDPALRNPIRALFTEILDPVAEAHDAALSVGKSWQQLQRGLGGPLTAKDLETLAQLIAQSSEALQRGEAARQQVAAVGIVEQAPVETAEALLADPAFVLDRRTGKRSWDGFAA
ncbi:MAG: hypothetical protein KC457_31600, partial [Myxococcales bacterium]|nr:hypothetical protein [Myxococcales bacterium]